MLSRLIVGVLVVALGGAGLAPLSARAQAAANAPEPVRAVAAASRPDAPQAGVPAEAPAADGAARPARIVLALPGAETPYGRAAEAVREGFRAGRKGEASVVEVIEVAIDESPAQWAGAVSLAGEREAALIVGALTRGLAQAVGGGAKLPLPALLLNVTDAETGLAPGSLVYGLSVEQEARFLVAQALREVPPPPASLASTAPRFAVLVGGAPLDRRVAQAFRDALRAAGQLSTAIEVPLTDEAPRDAAAEREALAALGRGIARMPLDAVFLALGARDAAAVRPRLPRDVPVYATSQVHAGGAEAALLAHDLEGVRFVDAPWLLEPDHPAVMVYPRSAQPLSAELQRLYALGIDAFRLALVAVSGRSSVELDGVTGVLRADRTRGARIERVPALAVFRNGRVDRGPATP